ncbi:hypothetical protein [Brasilonema octagenarum]|uniref:Uncharacterized protein n=1 Tax=Brasilonema octagenarum UFV-OR1 TaxID=417115 RepID=A0ABX1MA56_9CYAN|nr:hypothetical protein [Brasilonema octagenarum]NMF65479.1 hypothetical protein [Brasilonema octagenarum UFV-OR1]
MGKSTVPSKNRLLIWQPLLVRDFLLLFLGESVSLLGDQFYLVALPWLTIQLTHSPVILGVGQVHKLILITAINNTAGYQ